MAPLAGVADTHTRPLSNLGFVDAVEAHSFEMQSAVRINAEYNLQLTSPAM
jgi:hypothetical protein